MVLFRSVKRASGSLFDSLTSSLTFTVPEGGPVSLRRNKGGRVSRVGPVLSSLKKKISLTFSLGVLDP